MKEKLPSKFNFQEYEEKLISFWEKYTKFEKQKGKKTFIIILAPPNITGSLHMGHALGLTIQDTLARWRRMQGYKIVWIPGTDHAGIATQRQVEKYLLKEKGVTRTQIGREKFLEEVWRWKEKYGNIIIDQFKKIGITPDWSRLRFTLDPQYVSWVEKAFVIYYENGLIYRDFRPVNFCPRCQTSLSDLELERIKRKDYLYYIKYPLKDKNQYLLVATTRPETMLGDVALAVNSRDERFIEFIGQKAILPLLNRELEIIGDKRVDPKFGTGVLKVTPAHSLIDYEIAQRHNLKMIPVITKEGKIEEGLPYAGLESKEARVKILEDLKKGGFFEGVEEIEHEVPVCYRCETEIEVVPSKEWFLKMKPLADLALKAVNRKMVKIIPAKYIKPYKNWLLNVRDWCISRKIWWGQVLPVWYCKNCTPNQSESIPHQNKSTVRDTAVQGEAFIVSIQKPRKRCQNCGQGKWERTEEVFDTWFSSAIWPFAILYTKKEEKWYPADFASSAKDILHLWDTRMIFSGLYFKKKVPFKTLYIHPTVLTKEGKRMSKSLGTGIDPLELISKYGADATRFGLLWQIMRQQDIRFDEVPIENGMKFANKIWNAVRFMLIRLPEMRPNKNSSHDKKILNELKKTVRLVNSYLEKLEFGLAVREVYDFFWHKVCDVYLESCKGETKNNPEVLKFVIENSLKLLHPFLPFVTQALWSILGYKKPLFEEKWPTSR